MKNRSFSSIFSMVIVLTIALLIGEGQVRAEIGHNLLDDGGVKLLNLNSDKLLLDKNLDLPPVDLRLHAHHAVAPEGLKLNEGRILTLQKTDLLKTDNKLNLHLVKASLGLDGKLVGKLNNNKLDLGDIKLIDRDDKIQRLEVLNAHKGDRGITLGLLDNHMLLKEKELKDDRHDDLAGKKLLGLNDPTLDHTLITEIDKDAPDLSGLKVDDGTIHKAHFKDGLTKHVLVVEKKTLDLNPDNNDRVLHLNDLFALNDKRNLLSQDNADLLDLKNDKVVEADLKVAFLNARDNGHFDLGGLKTETLTISHEAALPDLGGAVSFFGLNKSFPDQGAKLDLPDSKKKDDIRNDLIKNLEWQWMNDPVSVLNALKVWFSDKNAALEILKKGQANNPGGKKSIELGASSFQNFWEIVAKGSHSVGDFSALDNSISWAYQNEWAAMNSSRESWNARPRNVQWAYYNLLWANRQNPEALKNLRACWSEDKEKVMASVEKWWKR